MNIIDLPHQVNSEALFLKLCQLPHCVWLDSGKPNGVSGRYDILSAIPSQIVAASGTNDLAQQLDQKLKQHANASILPFSGGWIGQLDYAYKHSDFGLSPTDSCNAWFGWYDWAIVVDHERKSTSLVVLSSCSSQTYDQIRQALSGNDPTVPDYTCSAFIADESKDHYLAAIARIHEYLLAGDCYQVNYTQRFTAHFSGSAAAAYLRLRDTVPSPFCAYLNLGERTLLSVSPERFIQIQQQQALTQPIKGTSRRSQHTGEDAELRAGLLKSEKNRSENVMIVDLLRNDLGQLCVPGSIKVPQLFEVQSYTNVHHLVSTITGTLPDHISHSELILACFPGGSITGAPKKRAMQIIDELEQHGRNAYCGSIGYFSCNRNTDFNIAIRTMVQENGQMHAWAGGGIVVESEPEAEYEECFAKIGQLMRALSQQEPRESPLPSTIDAEG